MTFAATGKISSLSELGMILKVISRGMVVDNLSTATGMFDYVYGQPISKPEGRENRFEVRTDLGSAAVGPIAIAGAQFKAGQKSNLLEGTANFKKFAATIEVDNSVIELATRDFACYGKPIAEEVEAKGLASARQLAMMFQRDGSGVIGEVSSVSASSGNAVMVLKATDACRGFVGWFDKNDKVKAYTNAGVTHNSVNGGTAVSYFKVVSRVRSTDTVTLSAWDASDVQITVSSLSGSDLAANDYIIRSGTVANDWAAVSTNDFDGLSTDFLGLEAFTHASAKVHGLTHGTDIDVTSRDCGAAAIESKFLQAALTDAELNCGEGRYKYDFAWMQPEGYNAVLDQNETDRRFQTIEMIRGAKELGFQFKDQLLRFKTDPFIRSKRIWMIPKGTDVIQFLGTEMQPVQAEGGPKWHLKSGSGVYYDAQQMFLEMTGLIQCVHNAAVIKINNFTV